MTDLAAPVYDDLDLSPEVLCSLLRRRSMRAHRDPREDGDDTPRTASQEHLYAAWL